MNESERMQGVHQINSRLFEVADGDRVAKVRFECSVCGSLSCIHVQKVIHYLEIPAERREAIALAEFEDRF